MKFISRLACIFLTLLAFSDTAKADELVVVVNAASRVARLSHEEVVNIFLGRHRYYSSGLQAEPIDLPDDYPDKALFYRKLINKDIRDVNTYWARLLFSGFVYPPLQTNNASEANRVLLSSKGAISYMLRSAVDPRLVVVFSFSDKEVLIK